MDARGNIGKECTKSAFRPNKEPKPFKSGLKINTISGVIDHPHIDGELAYTFLEDDSYVACRHCKIVTS
jgi:hypothetical protein